MGSPVVWVVFDFGGVLLTTGNRELYEEAMQKAVARVAHPSIATPTDLKKRVYDGPEFQLAKTGKISSDELYESIFGGYGITDRREVLECRDAIRSIGKHVHPLLIQFIESLKTRPGHRIAVLSNYESDIMYTIERHGIKGLFPPEAIMSSYNIGFAKPNVDCFASALKTIRELTDKEEGDGEERKEKKEIAVIFIDDKEKNVATAGACGFHQYGVVYKSAEQCISEVEEALAKITAPPS